MRHILPGLAAALLALSCTSDGSGGSGDEGSGGSTSGDASAASGGSDGSGGTGGSGGADPGSGGASAGGSATGGVPGAGGGGSDAGSSGGASAGGAAADAGPGGKVSPVDSCQYEGLETTNCPGGKTKYWECGASTSRDSPDPSCVRPTTGPNLATRWCCSDPFCSEVSVVTQICSQVYPAAPNGYSCDPDLPELSVCRRQAGNGACCPF